ncbi:MAG: HlyD family efflux transporter periplasmic adaptor subunit [Thalassotalea sp.]|nr:HlyD family efflux transporter periplasmic adaptor subunit [Thalassotalea sp.]
MDIAKKKNNERLSSKRKLIIAVIASLLVLGIFAKNPLDNVVLYKKDLLISEVQQGDLAITVDGYGKLVSEKLQLITTLTQATVAEIILKPGAIVNKNSVIVKLANPELQFALENSEQELAQLKANLRQLIVNHKRELLTEQAVIAELESRYESAKLKRAAEQTLVEDGIVSELTFKQSQLNEKQLKQRMTILTRRLQQLSVVHEEAINIQDERIKQQLGRLNIAQNRLDKLHVRAGFDGVLQRLSVNLGQSLAPGQEVALIGSNQELIAEIKVSQNQASLVQLGQKVKIDTRQTIIIGTVSRIDPIVEQNTVRIDVSLPKTLPESAKPQQNIDAEIIAKTLINIKYIERPANIQSQSSVYLYQLNEGQNSATKKSIMLGEKTGRYIEVLSSVGKGEQFIISDLSNYNATNITLN